MKQIIVGTINPAKVEQIKGALKPIKIRVKGIDQTVKLPEIIEDGTVRENSRKKAKTYAEFLGETVLSMDNALYLDGLAAEQQPGTNVRRIAERTDWPTDYELLDYYSALIAKLGGKVNGKWEFAVCIAAPDGTAEEVAVIESPRIFTSQPCETKIPGYPLESLQIDPESGEYIAEMTEEERALFWQKAIGGKLMELVKKSKLIR